MGKWFESQFKETIRNQILEDSVAKRDFLEFEYQAEEVLNNFENIFGKIDPGARKGIRKRLSDILLECYNG